MKWLVRAYISFVHVYLWFTWSTTQMQSGSFFLLLFLGISVFSSSSSFFLKLLLIYFFLFMLSCIEFVSDILSHWAFFFFFLDKFLILSTIAHVAYVLCLIHPCGRDPTVVVITANIQCFFSNIIYFLTAISLKLSKKIPVS